MSFFRCIKLLRSRLQTTLMACFILASAACGRELPVQNPPVGTVLYNPTALRISPDGKTGYIINTNFDRRFSAGWVSSFDVATLLTPPYALTSIKRQVLIPSLGSHLALSSDGLHAFVPHRGSGLLTVLDMATAGSPTVTCGNKNDRSEEMLPDLAHTDCDAAHLLDLVGGMQNVGRAQGYDINFREVLDPAAVAFVPPTNSTAATVAVGFLNSGWLATVRPPNAAGAAKVEQNYMLGALGTNTLLALVDPAKPTLLAASRLASQVGQARGAIHAIDLSTLPPGAQAPASGPSLVSSDLQQALGGNDVVAVAVSPDQARVYAIGRFPHALVVLRRRAVQTGSVSSGFVPTGRLEAVAATALGEARLADVLYVPRAAGDLVVANSVADGTLYIFAVQGDTAPLVARIKLTEEPGPYALAYVRQGMRDVVLVTHFFKHGLAAVDVSGASYSDFNLLFEVNEKNDASLPHAVRHRH